MKSMEFYFGFVTAAVLVVVLFFVIRLGIKSKRMRPEFDERQIAARGRAFEVGFYTFAVCNAALAVANGFGFHWAASPAVEIFLVLFIAIGAFAITAICKDAYFGLNENGKSSTVLLALVALLNLIAGIAPILFGEETFLENGKASHTVLNFAVAVLLAAVIIASCVHKKKQMPSPDEEVKER